MCELLENALGERLALISVIKTAFVELYPELPLKLSRGSLQSEILKKLDAPVNGTTRRIVSDALQELGYRKVKIVGLLYYRKRGESNASQ